jgi:hypothetical protein
MLLLSLHGGDYNTAKLAKSSKNHPCIIEHICYNGVDGAYYPFYEVWKMNRPHVLVPGILFAVVFVILATSLIARPGLAEAFANSEAVATLPFLVGAGKLAGSPPGSGQPDSQLGIMGESLSLSTSAPTKAPGVKPTPSPAETKIKSSSSCSIPSRYPESIRRWCGLIETYAKKGALDPRLVAAVMLQESGGNPKAYSSSGAVGLMQVMPRDGLAAEFMCNGKPCFSSRPSMAELYDPEFNISYGTRMLAGLTERYGNTRDALKAYGPMDSGYSYADKVIRIFETYR